MQSYSDQSANEVWKLAASDLLKNGQFVTSRNGSTKETIHAVLEIKDPRQRWIIARKPPINPALAMVETIWMMNGRDDTALLTHWFRDYPKYVKNVSNQHAAYGKRLRRQFGFDQLQQSYEALKANAESRQIVLQVWSAPDDLPGADGQPKAGDIPCNVMACLLVRDGFLHWHQTLRSNDIDRGFPYNIVQFTMLQEVMAGWLGLQPGRYCHVAGSLHYYVRDSARLQIEQNVDLAANTDRFDHSFEMSMASFKRLSEWMDRICIARRGNQKLNAAPEELGLPTPFMNMAWVIAADDARRFGESSLAKEFMRNCTNPIYVQLWSRWLNNRMSTA